MQTHYVRVKVLPENEIASTLAQLKRLFAVPL
jgi:hypothetical protein